MCCLLVNQIFRIKGAGLALQHLVFLNRKKRGNLGKHPVKPCQGGYLGTYVAASSTEAYSMKEIEEVFGVYYSTVSRKVKG